MRFVIRRRQLLCHAYAVFYLIWILAAGGLSVAGEEPDAETQAGWKKIADQAQGFVVWESSRTGHWRIWRRNLDGTDLRQLIADEEGRDHFCPHISPDGTRIIFLSRPIGSNESADGVLRIINADGTGNRVLVSAARSYGGDRAAVWFDNQKFAFIDSEGFTQEFELESGQHRRLTAEGGKNLLINATRTYATNGYPPTFSPFDLAQKRITPQAGLPGCEPYFTHNGRWGYWMGGAGGPINRFELQSRQISPIINKDDERMPKGRRYLYFPMVSRDGRFFTFAASPNQHDHDKSDYDVFVAKLDPKSLEIIDRPVRYSFDPATDRYPDVYGGPVTSSIADSSTGPGREKPNVTPPKWPVHRDGLVYLFQTAASPNQVASADGKPRSYTLHPRLRGRWSHDQALVLTGGAFVAEGAEGQLLEACRQSQQLTVEAVIKPDHLRQSGPARIVTFSSSAQTRNFTLGQEREKLIFRLRTPSTGENGYNPEVQLAALTLGNPVHVTVSYRPGQLTAYIDGKEVYRSDKVQGDFSNWSPQHLLFGDEFDGQRNWQGTLEGVAIYSRALESGEVLRNAAEYHHLLAQRAGVPHVEITAKLLAKSPVPTLEEVKPYRGALMVSKYQVLSVVEGKLSEKEVLVTHWALLDGQTQPISTLNPGAEARLVLEPLDSNPYLQRFVCKDQFDSEADLLLPRYYDATP